MTSRQSTIDFIYLGSRLIATKVNLLEPNTSPVLVTPIPDLTFVEGQTVNFHSDVYFQIPMETH